MGTSIRRNIAGQSRGITLVPTALVKDTVTDLQSLPRVQYVPIFHKEGSNIYFILEH